MSATRKLLILCSVVLCGVLVIVAGCDRESRYKVLTFFFEGVPPLDGEKDAAGSGVTTTDESLQSVVGEKPVSRVSKQSRKVKHKPVKNCNKCHMGGMNSGQRKLIMPMPDLCYSCHTNYHEADGYVHGPIAVGDCIFCHDPHGSKYVHLLKAPQPKLCEQCHIPEYMEFISGHETMPDTICTDCHDPHVSSMKKLLKPIDRGEEDPNTVNLSN